MFQAYNVAQLQAAGISMLLNDRLGNGSSPLTTHPAALHTPRAHPDDSETTRVNFMCDPCVAQGNVSSTLPCSSGHAATRFEQGLVCLRMQMYVRQ